MLNLAVGLGEAELQHRNGKFTPIKRFIFSRDIPVQVFLSLDASNVVINV